MEKKLLFSVTKKDFKISYFSGSGAGGQHRNKHKNCVRIQHPASGTMAIGTEERSLARNKIRAFKRLTGLKKFKAWLNLEASKVCGDLSAAEAYADREISNLDNLKIEYLS